MTLDIQRVRADFPYLAQCNYLNTASAGLSPADQGRAAAEFYDVAKSKGIRGVPDWTAKAEALKASLSDLLNVPVGAVHFVGSTTEALNLVALSLPLAQGDQVVLAEDEFPSLVQPWLTWQMRGVEMVRVPVPSEAERTDVLCRAVTSRVRALSVSHVHWRTGTRVDLSVLSAVCRRNDCRLIVDGVQAVGAIPVDAGAADAYCASVFKWLLSGFGLGIVTLSERLAAELSPVLRGYENEPPSRSIRYGHLNYPGIYALQASLEYLHSVGWQNVHDRVAALALRAISSLRRRGLDVVTLTDKHAGIVSIRHPAASAVVRSLAEQNIHVEDGRPIIRASPHFYNTEEEVDCFVDALARSA